MHASQLSGNPGLRYDASSTDIYKWTIFGQRFAFTSILDVGRNRREGPATINQLAQGEKITPGEITQSNNWIHWFL
jgi:hypothetical protein